MINRDNPMSKKIFTAARYIGRINMSCGKYILEAYEERKITFQKMKTECKELDNFSQIHFERSNKTISEITHQIILEIEKLETINNQTDEGNCKVCNTKLKTFDTLISDEELKFKTVCESCPKNIYKLLTKLEWPTLTALI